LSIKENFEAVKKEIGTEEQFLEGLIKSEWFFKKYKKSIIYIAVLLVIGGISYSVNDIMKTNNLQSSNEAYNKLLTNPNDSESLNILKEKNERLYSFYRFQVALKANDVVVLKELSTYKYDPVIADLASYQLSGLEETKMKDSKLLKGFNLLQNGYDLILQDKIKEAKLQFAQIDLNSPLKNISNNLEHYQGKKIQDKK